MQAAKQEAEIQAGQDKESEESASVQDESYLNVPMTRASCHDRERNSTKCARSMVDELDTEVEHEYHVDGDGALF